MALTIRNNTEVRLAVPAPIEDILGPRETKSYALVEYDAVFNDFRFSELIRRGIVSIQNDEPGADPSVIYGETVTVAKTGGDYATIQAAVDSITDAAADKPYIVLIYPGVYDEDVRLKDYVSLHGIGGTPNGVIINGTGTTIEWPAGGTGESDLSHVTVRAAITGGNANLISANDDAAHYIRGCTLDFRGTDAFGTVFDGTGSGALRIFDSIVFYTSTGTTPGVNHHFGFRLDKTGGDVFMTNSFVFAQIADPDDNVSLLEEAQTSDHTFMIKDTIFAGVYTGPVPNTGNWYGFRPSGVTNSKEIRDSKISIGNTSGSSSAIRIDTAASNGNVLATGCYLDVSGTGAGTDRWADCIGGDTLTAMFCTVRDVTHRSGLVNFTVNDFATQVLAISGPLDVTGKVVLQNPSLNVSNLKSGIDQAAAGAGAGELWADTSDGNTVKLGV